MADPAALAEIERRIQIVEANLRELMEQAAPIPAQRMKSVTPIASPTSRRSWMRC
jgi:hypothetical protein